MNEKNYYDVIVSGIGSMGSAACYYLSRANSKVLGLEQFAIPHDKGSHAGQTRIIRKAYYEDPAYVPLLERAYHNWNQVQDQAGHQLYYKTGLLYHGKPDHPVIKGSRLSASINNIELNDLTPAEAAEKFPQFHLPAGFISFLEPDAGFITPEKAVKTFVAEAKKNGAEIRSEEKLIEWKKESGGLKVITDKAVYFCKKLVITAGAWTDKIIPKLRSELSVTRQTLAWMKPSAKELFELGTFPCWMMAPENKGGVYYGFPIVPANQFDGPVGLKMAYHHPAGITDPDQVDRNISARDEEEIRAIVKNFFPSVGAAIAAMKTCLYTNTPDENFIIDFLPEQEDNVIVACGFSGHGFKFVSVVGEILSELAHEGKSKLPIDFLRLSRFK
ncbi:MAG: N-methyl-L-tryptophan oxidase [Flavitalea sp.]